MDNQQEQVLDSSREQKHHNYLFDVSVLKMYVKDNLNDF